MSGAQHDHRQCHHHSLHQLLPQLASCVAFQFTTQFNDTLTALTQLSFHNWLIANSKPWQQHILTTPTTSNSDEDTLHQLIATETPIQLTASSSNNSKSPRHYGWYLGIFPTTIRQGSAQTSTNNPMNQPCNALHGILAAMNSSAVLPILNSHFHPHN